MRFFRLAASIAALTCLNATAIAADDNHGYPTGFTMYEAGELLLCHAGTSHPTDNITEALKKLDAATEKKAPVTDIIKECGLNKIRIVVLRNYVGSFEGKHLAADLLEVFVFTELAPGLMVSGPTYYGMGGLRRTDEAPPAPVHPATPKPAPSNSTQDDVNA